MWPTTASRSMPCGALQGRGSSSRAPACRWPRRSWAMPASIPPAATSLWPASRSASAACRWRSSPASRRGCDEHIHQQFRTPHRGDARMANLAGTQPARHAERDDGFRQVLLIASPQRDCLGAGLRPPEARRLRRHDVDAENAMVMIERSKRNKDRRVPVTEDLAGLLARFDHLADLRRPDREWFFEDQPGRQYSPAWLIASYHRCCELAGGIAPASTPYTLRHNYATRTLMRWVEEGKDIEAWLPYLAAYMGHQKYSSTAWYVHLLPERLAATGLTRVAGIIPAVTS